MSVHQLPVARSPRATDDEDHPGNQVLAFLRNLQLGAHTCFCGNDEATRGRDVIHAMAIDSLLNRDIAVPLENVSAVLRYLRLAEVVEGGKKCHGHGGDVETCGFHTLLGWLADAIDEKAE
jgi:hypothetical protein